MGFEYCAANPNEFLAVTGRGIEGIKICKTHWKKPFQRVCRIDVSPRNYDVELHAMSSEKLEFLLPAVFTIGPNVSIDNEELTKKEVTKYAIHLANSNAANLDILIKGIVEGEVRVLAASMTIEEIFKSRAAIKNTIVENIQKELDHFGLFVFNANIKELHDAAGSEYFTYMRQKTREGAINQSKIDISEAKLKGTTGEKEREGKTRTAIAEVESNTIKIENSKKQEMMDSETALKMAKIELDRQTALAELERTKALEKKALELSIEVEMTKQKQNTERLRAEQLTKAQVDLESSTKLAEAKANQLRVEVEASSNKLKREAEANAEKTRIDTAVKAERVKKEAEIESERLEIETNAVAKKTATEAKASATKSNLEAEAIAKRIQMEAEATALKIKTEAEAYATKMKAEAEANATRIRLEAEANLIADQNKAAGKKALYDVETERVTKIMEAFKGNGDMMLQYLMFDQGRAVNRKAFYDVETDRLANIVKSFGSTEAALNYLMIENDTYSKLAAENAKAVNGLAPKITVWDTTTDGQADPLKTIRDVYQALPPLFGTVYDQTGMMPPRCLLTMPNTQTDSTKSTNQTSQVPTCSTNQIPATSTNTTNTTNVNPTDSPTTAPKKK